MSHSEALSRLTVGDEEERHVQMGTAYLPPPRSYGVVGLAAPAAAQVSDQPAVSVYTMSPERIAATVAAVVGLIGAVIGGLALARSAGRIGTGNGRRGAIVALVMGPIGLVIGGLVVATADGGLGTGNGLGGGSWPWWWG